MDAMIDLETLNVGPGSPLFQIGVVTFDSEGISGEYFYEVDLLDVILTTGFMPNKDTVAWWQKQTYNPAGRDDQLKYSLENALTKVSRVLTGVEQVWANSPAFDCVILGQHYQACGLPVPWTHRQERDYRTIKWWYQQMNGPVDESQYEATHNALEDAIYQTQRLMEMINV